MSNNSAEQARLWIEELLREYEQLQKTLSGETDEYCDEFGEYIPQWEPLGVYVRSSWKTIGKPLTVDEYMIELTTGGPAVWIEGSLDESGLPATVKLYHLDWFEPAELYPLKTDEEEKILDYLRYYLGPLRA